MAVISASHACTADNLTYGDKGRMYAPKSKYVLNSLGTLKTRAYSMICWSQLMLSLPMCMNMPLDEKEMYKEGPYFHMVYGNMALP